MSKEYDRKTRLQFVTCCRVDFNPLDRRMRVLIHVDETDAAVCRAKLILNSALLPEMHGLHLMRLGRQFIRREPSRGKTVKRSQKRHRNRRRSTC